MPIENWTQIRREFCKRAYGDADDAAADRRLAAKAADRQQADDVGAGRLDPRTLYQFNAQTGRWERA